MKRLIPTLAVLSVIAGPAMGDMMWVKMGVASGGNPYLATVVSDPSTPGNLTDGLPIGQFALGQTFETFCVEHGEFFGSGVTYRVTVDPYAILGGTEDPELDPPDADLLDSATAFLYSNWMSGNKTFASVTYTAAEFQNAIWHIEDEIDGAGKSLDLANYAILNANGGNYGVAIMNLWEYSGGKYVKAAQSQLVLVPAPGVALLMGLGFGLVGWFKRRLA